MCVCPLCAFCFVFFASFPLCTLSTVTERSQFYRQKIGTISQTALLSLVSQKASVVIIAGRLNEAAQKKNAESLCQVESPDGNFPASVSF